MERLGGLCKMSTLVHSRGEGVKNGQNLVHVVVECPLRLTPTTPVKP
jgi:hypothetical protein